MFEMVVDPKTGMMDQPNFHDAFGSHRKVQFLKYLEKKAFKILEACDAIGISHQTYYKGLEKDLVFRERVEELKARRIEEVEQTLADCATEPSKTIDRIFFLKCWKPAVYNPVQKFENTQQVVFDITRLDTVPKPKYAKEAELIEKSARIESATKD